MLQLVVERLRLLVALRFLLIEQLGDGGTCHDKLVDIVVKLIGFGFGGKQIAADVLLGLPETWKRFRVFIFAHLGMRRQ